MREASVASRVTSTTFQPRSARRDTEIGECFDPSGVTPPGNKESQKKGGEADGTHITI